MRFETRRIYTGTTKRESKEGKEYTLISFLDDEGQTFTVVSDVEVPNDVKQLDSVFVEFELSTGKYKNLRVKRIWK